MAARFIAKLSDAASELPTRQYLGFPPELTGGLDQRTPMPPASILIVDQQPDGIFLLRYSSRGEFAGDTWHEDFEEAKSQAEFEYPGCVSEWESVVGDVTDCKGLAL